MTTLAPIHTVKMTADQYLQLGEAPHYWIIDSEARLAECYELRGNRYEVIAQNRGSESATFPSFSDLPIPLSELWHASS